MKDAVAAIRRLYAGDMPRLALVLGSGLGPLAAEMQVEAAMSYADIPGFPQPAVEGHAGRLLIGALDGVPLICMQGRMHAYEGHAAADLALPIRTLKALGADTLILTNAAGALDPAMSPGSLMAISDHINFAGINPLIGPNDDSIGPRFFDMSNAWDKALRAKLRDAAAAAQVKLHEGVYLMVTGPNFETPAEIRAFRTLGADAVGMSTVPECLAAVHCGLKVAGISVITNMAAGLSDEHLSHDHTQAVAQTASQDLRRLLGAYCKML